MTSIRRAGRQLWTVAIALVMFLVAVGLPVYLDHEQTIRNRATTACVADWANRFSARSAVISKYTQQKEAAFTIYARLRDDGTQKAADQARDQYDLAQAELAKQLGLHPPPVFTCAGKPPALAPVPPATSVLVVPGPTKTRTATPPRTTSTAVVTVPGATITNRVSVPQPGNAHTVIRFRTRTVTRTVGPPSCLVRPLPPCVLAIPNDK